MNFDYGAPFFYLVKTKAPPKEDDSVYKRILDDSDFSTDFTSEEECQTWFSNEHGKTDYLDELLFIADARSANDHSLIVMRHSGDPIMFGENEDHPLPPEKDKWYHWRVKYTDAHKVFVHLTFYGEPAESWPIFHERQGEIVDEYGVVEMKKAEELVFE